MKPLYGTRAISFLCKTIQSEVMNVVWPLDWDKLSTKTKLIFLGKYLPKDTELLLIREPKWTRRKRSLYYKLIQLGKDKNVDLNMMAAPAFDEALGGGGVRLEELFPVPPIRYQPHNAPDIIPPIDLGQLRVQYPQRQPRARVVPAENPFGDR